MTEWVRHNESAANLFSLPSAEPDQIVAAVDTNVFCDLHGVNQSRRRKYSGTVALLSASQQIRLARPFSLTGELNKTVNQRERDALLQTAAVSGMKVLNSDRRAVRELRDQLFATIPQSVRIEDESLLTDAVLVAESILGGADVFVTRDFNVVTHIGPAAAEGRAFAVLFPDELPAFIDRRADATSYLPVQLAETRYQVTRGDSASWNPDRLSDLLSRDTGERKVEFRQRLAAVAVPSAGTDDRQMMLTPSGEVLAIWAVQTRAEVLEVPLLRIRNDSLLPTIARQICRALRRRAATAGLASVRVQDPRVLAAVSAELRRDGFSDRSGTLTATVLATTGTWEEVRESARETGGCDLDLPLTLSSAAEASEYERVLWPAKILHPGLPTYFVPIRGVFADDLLGHIPTLVARPDDLGLSREHVYYRNGRSRPSAPGRILWYSSRRDKAVVACSRLVESVTGTPEVLHREFANIGVLTLDQVRDVRDKRTGKVTAVRFADTEILARPILLSRAEELLMGTAKLTIQSPVPVDPQAFKRLYTEGMLT